jgi:hypothetical protein
MAHSPVVIGTESGLQKSIEDRGQAVQQGFIPEDIFLG